MPTLPATIILAGITDPVILSGMATVYTAHSPGAPLYCDRGNGLTFFAVQEPWVALDVSEYTSGRAHCGDIILLRLPASPAGGKTETHTLRARALDAGPLYPYSIADTGLPIVVDIPRHQAPFTGTSHPATVINVSAMRRLAAEVIPQ